MIDFKTIQGKALLLLITFVSNFFVVCHCQASEMPMASHRHSCCCKENTSVVPPSHHGSDECPATHSVKFNLLEKQVAPTFLAGAPTVAMIAGHFVLAVRRGFVVNESSFRRIYFYKHSPPDLPSLYQRFLI